MRSHMLPARTRIRVLIVILVVSAIGFMTVKILQTTGVIRSGGTHARAHRPPPTYTIEDVIETFETSSMAFQPGIEALLFYGVVTSEDGQFEFSDQVAPGGRRRLELYSEEGLISALVCDGANVWVATDEGLSHPGAAHDTMLAQSSYGPLFLDDGERGHVVRSVENRDGAVWVTVDASDGSLVEYQVDMSHPLVIVAVRWTWPEIDGVRYVEETRYASPYGVGQQMLALTRERTILEDGTRRTSRWQAMQYAVTGQVPEGYFTPDGWHLELWERANEPN